MSDTKKYYWLKLKRDFFKRHDIKIIESMDNGKDYVLFYLKLLLESVDHNGELRFSETVPYNDKMLSTITDTNIDIVRSAVKIFSELGMMERFDDGTLYMEQVNTMLGFETSDAIRMRKSREKKAQLLIEHGESEQCSKPFKNRSPELELDIDKELDKELREESPKESAPVPEKLYSSESYILADLLSELHIKNIDQKCKPITPKQNQSWAKDIEMIERLDGRSYQDIEKAIRWIKTPGQFWAPNIMSGSKLREKFSTIWAQMSQQRYAKSELKVNQRTTMLDLEE